MHSWSHHNELVIVSGASSQPRRSRACTNRKYYLQMCMPACLDDQLQAWPRPRRSRALTSLSLPSSYSKPRGVCDGLPAGFLRAKLITQGVLGNGYGSAASAIGSSNTRRRSSRRAICSRRQRRHGEQWPTVRSPSPANMAGRTSPIAM